MCYIQILEEVGIKLTPPGAVRVWADAWKTFGGSSFFLEYVITEEEVNECPFGLSVISS